METLLCRVAKKQQKLSAFIEDNNKENNRKVKRFKYSHRLKKQGIVMRSVRKPLKKGNLSKAIEKKVPKHVIFNNEVSKCFWIFVNEYCRNITPDDINFLEDLIKECSEPTNGEMPSLGPHYADEWDINKFMNTVAKYYGPRSAGDGLHPKYSKGEKLLLDKILKKRENKTVLIKGKNSRSLLRINNGLCLERSRGKSSIQKSDELLNEIKKCQEELTNVNTFNLEYLRKLKNDAVVNLNCKSEN